MGLDRPWRDALVWVTGASSGIGAALASELAGRGARLILSSRRAEALESVRRELPRPDAHHVVPLDLSRPEEMAALAGGVVAQLGVPDVLINNAGVSQRSLAIETDLAVDRALIETNYLGTVALTKAVLPAMLARGSGCVCTVTSLMGKFGGPVRSGYAASKHALHGFFESLRAEIAGRGVDIVMVCPGFIRTPLPRHALTADGTPQGRMDRAQLRGIDPVVCARRIARAIERGRPEVVIAGRERAGLWLARWAPWLLRRVLPRARVT